ncbi:MAG TPA: biotin/lipoyl-binding protein, partial [Steroidobacteraceae bacterium]|nr:biotin/lipoyl-binding protein [Steroidobacteraceae bacterium]
MTQQIIIIWAATAVATFSGLVGCTAKSAADAIASTRTVQVMPVQMAILDNTLRAVGLLTPKDEARLSFKVGGLIESIKVEEGQAVKAGQVLAVLKQTEVSASVEQARQATAKAKRDLERGKALLADGVTTEEQVQDLTTAFN